MPKNKPHFEKDPETDEPIVNPEAPVGEAVPASADPEERTMTIEVNGRFFDARAGVKDEMTAGEIAALVGIPERYMVRRLSGGTMFARDDETLSITEGMRFRVERQPEVSMPAGEEQAREVTPHDTRRPV